MAEVRYENRGGNPEVVSPFDWTVTDAAGDSYTALPPVNSGTLAERQLSPNRSVAGLIGFDVPQNASGLQLR